MTTSVGLDNGVAVASVVDDVMKVVWGGSIPGMFAVGDWPRRMWPTACSEMGIGNGGCRGFKHTGRTGV